MTKEVELAWYRNGIKPCLTSFLEELLEVTDDPVYRAAIRSEIISRLLEKQ